MHQGTCHCGAVKLTLPSTPEVATACNCSLCRRIGGPWVYFEFGTVRIEGHPENTSEYIQGDRTLRTVRCRACGCVTHWEPLDPRPGARHGVHLGNFDPELIATVKVRRFDGADTWKFLDEMQATNQSEATTSGDQMSESRSPVALNGMDVPPRATVSTYPEPYASRVQGREKRQLGDAFGLKNFGVNLTRLVPGAMSALRHAHAKQDEFVYILEGSPNLVTDEGQTHLSPGMCAGFRCGTGNAHHLVNESEHDVVYLEIGDRTPGESATYPDDDLRLVEVDGQRRFVHRDGTPY